MLTKSFTVFAFITATVCERESFGGSWWNSNRAPTTKGREWSRPWNDIGYLTERPSGLEMKERIRELKFLSGKDSKNPEDQEDEMEYVCETDACLWQAMTMLEWMNETQDPCEDFYNFACGRWIQDHPLKPGLGANGILDEMNDVLKMRVMEMIRSDLKPEDSKPVEEAKRYFDECIDTAKIDRFSYGPLIRQLLKYNLLPPMLSPFWSSSTFDLAEKTAVLLGDIGLTPLLTVEVAPDLYNANSTELYLSELKFVIPATTYVSDTSNLRTAYGNYFNFIMQKVATSLGIISNKRWIMKCFDEIFQLELQLAKAFVVSPNFDLRRTSVAAFMRNLNPLLQGVAKGQRLSYDKILTSVLRRVNYTLEPDELLYIYTPSYLITTARIVAKTKASTLANYLAWALIRRSAEYVSGDFEGSQFHFGGRPNSEVQMPRETYCIEQTLPVYGFALACKYINEFKPDGERGNLTQMALRMKAALKRQITGATWLSSKTKAYALVKADAMVESISGPDWIASRDGVENYYKDLNIFNAYSFFDMSIKQLSWQTFLVLKTYSDNVERTDWPVHPLSLNAFYYPNYNALILPTGISDFPYWTLGGLPAINFARIGYVLGHEHTHGFDNSGRSYDAQGSRHDWWTNEDAASYGNRSQCFVDQYSKFETSAGRVNATATLGENLADNGGMQAAFLAFEEVQQEQEGKVLEKVDPFKKPVETVEPVLAFGLEEYSPEQVFFIAFGQNWCESYSEEGLASILKDVHSPAEFRVKGPLQNSEDFARAFDCPVGTEMNPEIKCRLW